MPAKNYKKSSFVDSFVNANNDCNSFTNIENKSKTKRYVTSIEMNKNIHEEIKILSVKTGKTLKQILEEFVLFGLDNYKKNLKS